jgi:5-methylcytosine-specific restriction protein A
MRQGRTTSATEVDHITPKAKGGTDDDDNLQAICADHHREKTAREAAEAKGHQIKDRPKFDKAGRVIW